MTPIQFRTQCNAAISAVTVRHFIKKCKSHTVVPLHKAFVSYANLKANLKLIIETRSN